MFPSYRELILDSAISRMSESGGVLSVATGDKDIYQIDLVTLKILQKISLSHENPNKGEEFDYYQRALVVKDELAYVKFDPDEHEYIINTQDADHKKLSFNYSKNERIAKAIFSDDKSLLITGSEKGKTNLIDTSNGALVYDFPFSADSISALAISEDKLFAITASFDKSLKILHVNSLSVSDKVKVNGVIERMAFIDLDIFLAITRDGRALKIDARNKLILAEIQLPHGEWPSELIVSASKKFSYVGTRDSRLIAIFNETFESVYEVGLQRTGVTAFIRTPKYFIIGYKSGEIQFFNHREFEDSFVQNIELQNLKEAKILFEKNIFLMTHRATKRVYELWCEKKIVLPRFYQMV